MRGDVLSSNLGEAFLQLLPRQVPEDVIFIVCGHVQSGGIPTAGYGDDS